MENGDRIGKDGVYFFPRSKWGHTEMFILPLSRLPEFLRVSFRHLSGRMVLNRGWY